MNDKLPSTVSLSQIQRELAETGQYKEVEASIRRALTAQSCLADLIDALDCLDALQKHQALGLPDDDVGQRRTEEALLRSAVILYARATSTKTRHSEGKERGPSQVHDALSSAERADHEMILDVRNRAQAHVYTDEVLDNIQWHRSEVLSVYAGGGWLAIAVSVRTTMAEQLKQALIRQVPVAHRILDERTKSRLGDLGRSLNKYEDDQAFLDLQTRYLVNLAEVLGSEAHARDLVSGMADKNARRFCN